MFDFYSKTLAHQIEMWLAEDMGMGDVTSLAVIPENHRSKAIIHAKQPGVVAGLPLVERVFAMVDLLVDVKCFRKDGDFVEKGDMLCELEGDTRSILAGERLALNLLQRLSGIATTTREFVAEVDGLPVRIVDTRKTTPGLRMLEKYAVRVGGGYNHRFGLFDAVMIKDNHIKAAGSLAAAIRMARTAIPHTMKIEVEIESLTQISDALGADIIMLDNMSLEQMSTAVENIRESAPHILIEASGSVSRLTVRNIALTGVDIISAGSLTHSVKSLDISLDLYTQKESRP
jgi:nicotinate-nucleotide pyrophosphorylase (carboxylating)